MEDIKKLQMALMELMEEESKDIMLALIPNISELIVRFCNEHAISQVPDVASPKAENTTPAGGFGLVHSNTIGSSKMDFTSLQRKYEMSGSGSKGVANHFKKLPTMSNVLQMNEQIEENDGPESYIISAEYKAEQVYQELMPKLLLLDEHIHAQIGLWRQHAIFLDKFAETFKLFHMPEL